MKKNRHIGTLTWLSRTIGKKRWYIFSLVLLQIFMAAAGICSALLFRTLIDQAVCGDRRGFFGAVTAMAVLMLSQMGIRALGNFLYEWSRASIENQLKDRLFSCLLHKDYGSVTAIHSGEWMNRLTSDTTVVAGGIIEIVPGLTGMVARLVGALAVLFVLEPLFVALLIPGGGLILLFTYGFRKVLKCLHKRIQEADGKVRIFLQERLENLMIVHTFSMEKETEEAAREKMNGHKAARLRRNHLSNLCNTAFGTAVSGFYLFGVGYCGYGILNGSLSYGTMMAVLQLMGQIQSPFAGLTGYFPRYYAMIASAERLREAERFEEDCPGDAIAHQEILRYYQEELKALRLRRASFTYRSLVQEKTSGKEDITRSVVLSGIDLEIQKGEYVAFTGHSGCGKSTLLKLLMCLYPLDQGERYLTGTGSDGVTADQPLTAGWRGLFAYVPQGNQLMSGTIREILAFGDQERMGQESRLWEALQIACADEFVNALEEGLDTMLGERGTGLSEGQMQRIAIARAIASGHPVLMLDESTSSLDEGTEGKLLTNLRAMTDRTVLIVTHRPQALQICDKQIVMTQDGRVKVVQGVESARTDISAGAGE